jgi:biotin carboxyl carrier protein
MPLSKLKSVLAEFDKSTATEMTYEDADFCVTLKKDVNQAPKTNSVAKASNDILCPLVGTYYNSSLAIKKGQRIQTGQVLCVIESMKIMNKICAPADLVVKKKYYKEGDLVELNSKLFEVEYV